MDTLDRFSNRVENYIKFRPHYPDAIIAFLNQENILNRESVVADIGSGTGISSLLFLKQGNRVYGIEPNKEMREAAEKLLKTENNFYSISAIAHATTLQDKSVDLIVAGQAFHWFDVPKSKIEFQRILKPDGNVILMWNDRRTESTPFLKSYEDFIKLFAIDYKEVNHKNFDETVFNEFFGENNYALKTFNNNQQFDLEGLKGRILSSSYMPPEGHKNFESMMDELSILFERFQVNGKVNIEYDTKIYYGKLN